MRTPTVSRHAVIESLCYFIFLFSLFSSYLYPFVTFTFTFTSTSLIIIIIIKSRIFLFPYEAKCSPHGRHFLIFFLIFWLTFFDSFFFAHSLLLLVTWLTFHIFFLNSFSSTLRKAPFFSLFCSIFLLFF